MDMTESVKITGFTKTKMFPSPGEPHTNNLMGNMCVPRDPINKLSKKGGKF